MRLTKINQVEIEIVRLQLAIAGLRLAHESDKAHSFKYSRGLTDFFETETNASSHTGAVKRASMDLTRALADLRKP
jgi:hypothetical protein